MQMTGRPRYETAGDLKNESEIVDALKSAWRVSARKLPISYGVDYALLRGAYHDRPCVSAFAEIKDRPRLLHGCDGGYYIAVRKAMSAQNLAIATGIRCLLVVRDNTRRIYYANLGEAPFSPVIVHGRTDRNDPDDMEPCSVIGWDKFRRVEERNMNLHANHRVGQELT